MGSYETTEEVLQRYHAGPITGVFTDGSCEGNPGPGGWGFVWVRDNDILGSGSGGARHTTNNRMELMALIEAYKMLGADADVVIYSDSKLCVDTVNQWAVGWEKRGWKRKGGEIKNLELVQALYALAKEHPAVELRWIKAHDGSRWNEYADALANAAVRR